MNLVQDSRMNHRASVVSGVLAYSCGEILRQFFRALRLYKKRQKN